MRLFLDGDIIVHYRRDEVNCIYVRMNDAWHRAPNEGFNESYDDGWDHMLNQGVSNDDERGKDGYVFVGNARVLAANAIGRNATYVV